MTDIEIHGPNTSAALHLVGYAVAGMLTRGRFHWSCPDTLVVTTSETPDAAAETIGRYVRTAVQTRGWLGLGAKYAASKPGMPEMPLGSKDCHLFLSPFLSRSGDAVRVFETSEQMFSTYRAQTVTELKHGGVPASRVPDESVEGKMTPKGPEPSDKVLPDDGTGLNWTHRYRKREIAASRVPEDVLTRDVIRGLGKPSYWGNKSDASSGPSHGATQYIQFLELSGVDPLIQNILIPAARANVVAMSDAEIMDSLCRGTEPNGQIGANTSCDFDVAGVSSARTVLALHSLAFVPIAHLPNRKSVSGGTLNRDGCDRVRDTTHLRLPVFSVPMTPRRVYALLSDARWSKPVIDSRAWLTEQMVRGWCEFSLAVTSTANNSYGRFSGGKFTAVDVVAR